MNKQSVKFGKVSEWIAAGGMASGFYTLERIEVESDKAIAFKAEKYNEYGNLKPAKCWVPKAVIQCVDNDYYTNGPARMFLIPAWMYEKKSSEGFVL